MWHVGEPVYLLIYREENDIRDIHLIYSKNDASALLESAAVLNLSGESAKFIVLIETFSKRVVHEHGLKKALREGAFRNILSKYFFVIDFLNKWLD